MTAPHVGADPAPPRAGYPLVVATLPGRTAEALREEMGQASEAGADLVEVRLDRLPPKELPRLEHVHDIPITHPWVPAIATLRSRAEGGEGPDDPRQRQEVLARALESLPFSFVDLELERDASIEDSLREVDGRPLGVVRSAHLPEGTPTSRVLELLAHGAKRGGVAKVVLPASASRIVSDLIPSLAPWRGKGFVVHTTGGAGALLRVLAPRLGMDWVYCRLPGALREEVERSQLPADRMRRFVDSGPETPWYAVVGRPIGHTASPDLHASFLEGSRTGGIYIPLELASEDELMRVLPQLPALGLHGVNVTRPYKGTAYRMASFPCETVRQVHVANTLVPQAGSPSKFRANNTDVDALVRWFGELRSREAAPPPDRVLVLGSGGAARAAVAAAVRLPMSVEVLGRRPQAARALVEELGSPRVQRCDLDAKDFRPFRWVVHATPVGQDRGSRLDLPLEHVLARGGLLIDLVYRPAEPTLRDLATTAGARYVEGMPMLVYQAAASFELFTGQKAPAAAIASWLAPVAEWEAAA